MTDVMTGFYASGVKPIRTGTGVKMISFFPVRDIPLRFI